MIARLAVTATLFLAGGAGDLPPPFPDVACGAHDGVIKRMREQAFERVVMKGTVVDDDTGRITVLMEITGAPSGGWTQFMTNPETGQTCMVASGVGLDLSFAGKQS